MSFKTIHVALRLQDDQTVETIGHRSVTSLISRQQAVLVLLAKGCAVKESAALLSISFQRAEAHRAKIMERLQAVSGTEIWGAVPALGLSAED